VPAGTVIKGRYTVQEALGRGANAITYKAIDSTNGHEVCNSNSSSSCKQQQQQQALVSNSNSCVP
jgi:hypothetical protein